MYTYRTLQQLAVEIHKALNNLSSLLMSELFRVKKSKYSLRNNNSLLSNIPHTTKYGLNIITHLVPKIWEKIPNDVKDSHSQSIFKAKIKNWTPVNCPCNICRSYIPNLGFI